MIPKVPQVVTAHSTSQGQTPCSWDRNSPLLYTSGSWRTLNFSSALEFDDVPKLSLQFLEISSKWQGILWDGWTLLGMASKKQCRAHVTVKKLRIPVLHDFLLHLPIVLHAMLFGLGNIFGRILFHDVLRNGAVAITPPLPLCDSAFLHDQEQVGLFAFATPLAWPRSLFLFFVIPFFKLSSVHFALAFNLPAFTGIGLGSIFSHFMTTSLARRLRFHSSPPRDLLVSWKMAFVMWSTSS